MNNLYNIKDCTYHRSMTILGNFYECKKKKLTRISRPRKSFLCYQMAYRLSNDIRKHKSPYNIHNISYRKDTLKSLCEETVDI